MEKELRYTFIPVEQCNMCDDKTTDHKVLGKRLNQSQGKNPRTKKGITVTIMQCNNCGLIYSNPQPVPFSIQDHYGVPPEKYWTPEYFTISENYFAKEIATAKKLAQFSPDAKALDIGAGIGKCMIALEKAGFDSYGFEPSEPFYKRAIERMNMLPAKFKLGSMEQMEYPENYFDFITFGAVLEHLYDPSAALQKAITWLKPNGLMHIEIPSSDWLMNKLFNLFYRLTGTDYVANISPMHTPFHLHEFGLKSFIENGNKNHYIIAFHEYYVCETYMPKIFNYLLVPYMKYTDKGMQLCVWLRKKEITK